MTDIDGFAAQIAALDAVVTISGTAAHVAGTLGIPCIVVRDDKPILAWPVAGSHSPWYPATIIIRKQGRDWIDVLDDVKGTLQAVLKNDADLPCVH